MVSRVGAPTLGGSGYQPRRGESGLSKLGRLAQIGSGLAGIMERREHEAHRTAFMESKAALYEGLTALDNDPAMQELGLDERREHMVALIEDASGKMGEQNREMAAQLRLQGAVWMDANLADDRKREQERRISEGLEVRTRMIDESRARLRKVPELLMNPQTAGQGAALAGSVKTDFEDAIADFAPAIRDALMADFQNEAATVTVAHFLSLAETVEQQHEAYRVLRSNEDEVQVGGGRSFNLSGTLTSEQVEKLIEADYIARGRAYEAMRRERAEQDLLTERRHTKAANGLKKAYDTGALDDEGVDALLRDPELPQEVREELDDHVYQSRTRDGNMALLDPDQLALQAQYKRAVATAGTPEEVAAIEQGMLSKGDLHPKLHQSVYTAGQTRVSALQRAAASGTTEKVVTFTNMNESWDLSAIRAVESVSDPGSLGRLGVLEVNPQMRSRLEDDKQALRNVADAMYQNMPETRPFLDAIMPLAYEQLYEGALAGAGGEGRSRAEQWRAFLDGINSREAIESIAAMDGRMWMGFVKAAGLVDQEMLDSMVFHDDGRPDPDRTLLQFNDRELMRARASYPVQTSRASYVQVRRNMASMKTVFERYMDANRAIARKIRKAATEYLED